MLVRKEPLFLLQGEGGALYCKDGWRRQDLLMYTNTTVFVYSAQLHSSANHDHDQHFQVIRYLAFAGCKQDK
jgi:hypothetical protein